MKDVVSSSDTVASFDLAPLAACRPSRQLAPPLLALLWRRCRSRRSLVPLLPLLAGCSCRLLALPPLLLLDLALPARLCRRRRRLQLRPRRLEVCQRAVHRFCRRGRRLGAAGFGAGRAGLAVPHQQHVQIVLELVWPVGRWEGLGMVRRGCSQSLQQISCGLQDVTTTTRPAPPPRLHTRARGRRLRVPPPGLPATWRSPRTWHARIEVVVRLVAAAVAGGPAQGFCYLPHMRVHRKIWALRQGLKHGRLVGTLVRQQ